MGLLCMDEYLDERISPVKLIYWPDEATQIPAHWHTNMELNFIASGAMSLLENGRELRMEAGAVHFMNSGVVHRMEVGDSLGLTLVFSNKFIRELCPGTTAPHFDWNACPQQQEALREAVLPMYRLSQELYLNGQKIEDDPYTYLLVNSYLYRIAYLMVRYFRADTPEESSQVSGTNYHIQQAVDYIEKHFKEDLSAADVAAKAGLSREHFSRIFREYTGVTFKRFLTSLRLAVAYRLLVGTELSTMDIALSAGFLPPLQAALRLSAGGVPQDLCPALRPQINILPILAAPPPLGEVVFCVFQLLLLLWGISHRKTGKKYHKMPVNAANFPSCPGGAIRYNARQLVKSNRNGAA